MSYIRKGDTVRFTPTLLKQCSELKDTKCTIMSVSGNRVFVKHEHKDTTMPKTRWFYMSNIIKLGKIAKLQEKLTGEPQ